MKSFSLVAFAAWVASMAVSAYSSKPSTDQGIWLTQYSNGALAGPGDTSIVSAIDYASNSANVSAEWLAILQPPEATTIELSANASGEFRCWLGGHLAFDSHAMGPDSSSQVVLMPAIINITVPAAGMLLRCQHRSFAGSSYRAQVFVRERPSPPTLPNAAVGQPKPIPPEWTSLDLPSSDSKLLQFRNRTLLQGGWNTWENLHMLNFVRLPSAAELRLDVMEVATGDTLGNMHVFRQDNPARVQPGLHSLNDSEPFFMEVNVSRWKKHDCLVAFAASAETIGSGLVVSVASWGTGCDALAVVATGRAEWGRPFVASASTSGQFHIETPGLGAISVYSTAPPASVADGPEGSVNGTWPLSDGATFGFASDHARTMADIETILDAGRDRVGQKLLPTPAYWRDTHAALHSVIGWNTIYTPYEGMISPVSRGWDFGRATGADYVLFDWDYAMLSQMAAVDSLQVAWANILQILRAATAQPDGGFVPNFAAGEQKSYDRTEPYVGAQAALDLWARSSGLKAGLSPPEAKAGLQNNPRAKEWQWAVESVVRQLKGWNDWVVARRTGPGGIGGVVLGSDPPGNAMGVDGGTNILQAARYESGLDNSPAYDGNDHQCCGPVRFDNVTTHHMNLYDVGMAALYLADTEALAVMLELTGDADGAKVIQQRYEAGAENLRKLTLDPTDGRFWNRLYEFGKSQPGDFYKRDIPTLFYPLIAGLVNRTADDVDPFAAALSSPSLYNLAQLPTAKANVPNVMPGVNGTSASSSAAQLTQFWSEGITDNDLAAHPASAGMSIYTGHTHIRTEAVGIAGPPASADGLAPYQAACNDSGVVQEGLVALSAALSKLGLPPPVPLWRWYSVGNSDTLTAPSVPSTETPGMYVRQGLEAYCLSKPFNGSVGLTLWHSEDRKDYQVCGTPECLYDVENGSGAYRQVGSSPMCYGWSGASAPAMAPLPSVARNDSAFYDNTYWRGRTWGPMVYLTYQGLWRYRGVSKALDDARSTLVERGRSMVLTNWSPFGHVFENSNGTTGYGADAHNADPFYHWGALAGYIGMREAQLV